MQPVFLSRIILTEKPADMVFNIIGILCHSAFSGSKVSKMTTARHGWNQNGMFGVKLPRQFNISAHHPPKSPGSNLWRCWVFCVDYCNDFPQSTAHIFRWWVIAWSPRYYRLFLWGGPLLLREGRSICRITLDFDIWNDLGTHAGCWHPERRVCYHTDLSKKAHHQVDYYLSFFFLLDVISTATLLPFTQRWNGGGKRFATICSTGLQTRLDLTWISEAIQAPALKELTKWLREKWLHRATGRATIATPPTCGPAGADGSKHPPNMALCSHYNNINIYIYICTNTVTFFWEVQIMCIYI